MNFTSVLFSFSGRISRSQYWLGMLAQAVILGFGYLCLLYGEANQDLLMLFASLVLFIPSIWISLAVMAKRYHDRNKSAWWILVGLIPIIGGIWQLVELGLLKGTEGSNDYGADPCHSFNVAGDIEALRSQAGYKTAPAAVMAQPAGVAAAVAMPRQRSPYTDGRPVFGKRS